MNMLGPIQAGAPPKLGALLFGSRGQADHKPFTAKDLSPPGPEPPPPNDTTRRKEVTRNEQTAHSKKPDSPSQTQAKNADTTHAPKTEESSSNGAVEQPKPGEMPQAPETWVQMAAIATTDAAFAPAVVLGDSAEASVPTVQTGHSMPIALASATNIPATDEAVPIDDAQANQHVEFGAFVDAELPETQAPVSRPSMEAEAPVEATVLPEVEYQAQNVEGLRTGGDKPPTTANKPIVEAEVVEALTPVSIETSQVSAQDLVASPMDDAASAAQAQASRPLEKKPAARDSAAEAEPAVRPAYVKDGAPVAGAQADSAGDSLGGSLREDSADPATLDVPDAFDHPVANVPASVTATPVERRETLGVEAAGAERSLPQADVQRVVGQVADRIEHMAAVRPRDGVTIRLDPEHLGTITIKVMGNARHVEAELHASDESVRAALQNHRQDLASALSARGIQVQEVHVGSQAAGTHADHRQGLAHQGQQTNNHSARHSSGFRSGGTEGLSLESSRSFARNAVGVDLWI